MSDRLKAMDTLTRELGKPLPLRQFWGRGPVAEEGQRAMMALVSQINSTPRKAQEDGES